MGQFASRAFDGDPYIEIMRALPDREMIWWIQKVIWLAEGFTMAEHFGRTYHQLFVFKCDHCNGAGTVTCPHCHGYKVKRATSHNGFRLSEHTTVGRLLATAGSTECNQCGTYCPWDMESEWEGKWADWESKLAYYDKTYGGIMDEWYEDVINEGNLDEDTAPEEEPLPGPDMQGVFPDIDRERAKMPMRMKALMARFGGHPYENYDNLPFQLVDPTKPLEENLNNIGYNKHDLPPELNPEGFPEFLISANNPIAQFDNEVRMEYLIMQNLDAAIKDQPKPAQFGPTAGTVACPECKGEPYHYSFTPNAAKLFKSEPPFWLRTLSRMSAMGTWNVAASSASRRALIQAQGAGEEDARSGAGASSSSSSSAPAIVRGRSYGEVPREPPRDFEIQEALDSTGSLWHYRPSSRLTADQDYGPQDPLGTFGEPSSSANQLIQEAAQKKNPITGDAAAEAAWIYTNINPARNLARKVRDVRLAGAVEESDEEQVLQWLESRDSLAPEFERLSSAAAMVPSK